MSALPQSSYKVTLYNIQSSQKKKIYTYDTIKIDEKLLNLYTECTCNNFDISKLVIKKVYFTGCTIRINFKKNTTTETLNLNP